MTLVSLALPPPVTSLCKSLFVFLGKSGDVLFFLALLHVIVCSFRQLV